VRQSLRQRWGSRRLLMLSAPGACRWGLGLQLR
jgi:hypothetical protein